MTVIVSILSDSLGLPRGGAQPSARRQTWPALVTHGAEIDDVLHIGIGGATVTQLAGQLSYALASSPAVLVVQCGIVDCAPRALRLWERTALQHMPGGRRLSRIIEKRARGLRRIRDIAFTAPEVFRRTCASVVDRADATQVLWIGIVDAGDEAQVPGIRARIRAYNDILRATVAHRFVDVSSMPAEGVCADHHHLTPVGHAFVADVVLARISALKSSA